MVHQALQHASRHWFLHLIFCLWYAARCTYATVCSKTNAPLECLGVGHTSIYLTSSSPTVVGQAEYWLAGGIFTARVPLLPNATIHAGMTPPLGPPLGPPGRCTGLGGHQHDNPSLLYLLHKGPAIHGDLRPSTGGYNSRILQALHASSWLSISNYANSFMNCSRPYHQPMHPVCCHRCSMCR